MAEFTLIEWCDHSASRWWGCCNVHKGCDNCYAATWSQRWGNDLWGSDKPRKEIESFYPNLCTYQKKAKAAGKMSTVFIGSMMDIFEKPMRVIDNERVEKNYNTGELRQEFFSRVKEYPNLIFLLLTKRPGNINKYIPVDWIENPPSNIMYGTSISEQGHTDRIIKELSMVNGKKFLSIEPQLDLISNINLSGINWVIQGGESGLGKRHFDINWAYEMKKICSDNKVPYFFKQIDKKRPIPEDLMIREFPKFFSHNEFERIMNLPIPDFIEHTVNTFNRTGLYPKVTEVNSS